VQPEKGKKPCPPADGERDSPVVMEKSALFQFQRIPHKRASNKLFLSPVATVL
jgi:hypothetical protein